MYTNYRAVLTKLINLLEIRMKRTRLISRPLNITLEPTLRCNSNCIMCNRNFNRKEDKASQGFLSWEILNAAKPFFKHAKSVLFGGFGEALMHPDYIPMLKEIKKEGPFVYFFTNGILLTEETGQALVEAGIDRISISMGGASRETFHKIRGVDAFDQVVDNIRKLDAYKRKTNRKKPVLAFNVVAMTSILNEFEALMHLAKSVGVESVTMPNMVVQGKELMDESIWHHEKKARAAIIKAADLSKKLGIHYSPPNLDRCTVDCHEFFKKFAINWDGTVMSCPMERYIVGDLKKNTMEEIWNGTGMRGLRKRYFEEGIQGVCPNCFSWDNRPEAYLYPAENAREFANKLY